MCLRAVSLIAADWVSECVRPVSLALTFLMFFNRFFRVGDREVAAL